MALKSINFRSLNKSKRSRYQITSEQIISVPVMLPFFDVIWGNFAVWKEDWGILRFGKG